MTRSNKAKKERNMERSIPEKVMISIDIRTNKGEKVYTVRDKELDEVWGVILQILAHKHNVDHKKAMEKEFYG